MNKKIVRVLAVLLSAAVVSNIGTVTLEAEEVPEAKENEQVLEEDYEALETNGWYGDIAGGDRRYLDEKGQKLTGLQVIEGKTYYFNADGFLQTGWQQVNNKEYFFSYENGERYENRTENIDGIVFTFDRSGEYEKKDENIEVQEAENVTNQETTEESDGSPNKVLYNNEDDSQDEKNAILTGWKDTEDGRKYIGNNGDFVTGMQSIDGKLYYFNNEGILQYNWIVLGDNKYFALAEGSICIGWLKFGDIYYYCGSDGAIVKGLQKVGGKWYYFDDSGVRQTGWIDTGGKRYFGMPDGALHTGWLSFGSTYYYCESGGEIVRNRPYTVNGVCYYFDKDGKRTEALSGWQEHDGKKYFGMPDGTYRIGWLSFGSTYYYCGSDGALVKGLQKIGGKWYYFDDSGIRQTGWIDTGGKRYFGMPDGALHTGWLSFGSTYYFCNSYAEVVTGDYPINGVLFTFDKNGIMQKKSGWGFYNGKRYFFNPNTGFPYMNQWVTFGQTRYFADRYGIMVSGWQRLWGNYYYFYPNTNVMARNTVIDGYTIGSDGVRVPTALGKMTARAWGYTSLTNYLLMVDRASHKVGVYRGSSGNWSNIHFWDCGDGAAATPTVSGVFKVGMKGYYFDSGSARCFWYTQFYGNYLFHSVLCYKDGSIMDGRVGMALSHGCVRLQIANAKWIYDNIPRGTTVVVY